MSVSYKVMNIYEDKDTIIYRSVCDCGDESDDLNMVISIDENYDMLNICLSGNLVFNDDFVCCACNFLVRGIGYLKNIIRRITTAIKLIFTGRLEQNYEFIFSDEKHVKDKLCKSAFCGVFSALCRLPAFRDFGSSSYAVDTPSTGDTGAARAHRNIHTHDHERRRRRCAQHIQRTRFGYKHRRSSLYRRRRL